MKTVECMQSLPGDVLHNKSFEAVELLIKSSSRWRNRQERGEYVPIYLSPKCMKAYGALVVMHGR